MILGYIGFGVIDNGVLIAGAVAGFSLEDIINSSLEHIPGYTIKTRIRGLSSTLLGAGVSNAVSDLLGGFCVSPAMAFGTFAGCMLVVLACMPFIFKIEKEKVTEFEDFIKFALDKDYTFDDIMDFQEHYQNLLTLNENVKQLDEFLTQV